MSSTPNPKATQTKVRTTNSRRIGEKGEKRIRAATQLAGILCWWAFSFVQSRSATVAISTTSSRDRQRLRGCTSAGWHQASLDRPSIEFRLVHREGVDAAIGMVGYGRAYRDEALTEEILGRYELAHLVIDYRHQRRGIGRTVARAVLARLAAQPDCREIMVAHHPDNEPSRRLFLGLGFRPSDERNYDGDPVLLTEAEIFLR